MALSITFYNNIKYTKDDFMNRDRDFFGNGVVNAGDFSLTCPGGLVLEVGRGVAWVDGYRIVNDDSKIQLIVEAGGAKPRIDILQIGHDDVNTKPVLEIKQGIPADQPIEPGADAGCIKLYAVSVPAGATAVTSANLVDKRSLVPLNVNGSQIQMGGAVTNTDPAYLAVKNGAYVQPGSGLAVIPGSNRETVGIATGGVVTSHLASKPMASLPNLLDPSKQVFTRGSFAYKKDLTQVPPNALRTEQGKMGQAAYIEEGTTNLVLNSDFETVTGTAVMFSDALNQTNAPAWTVNAGAFAYSTSGAQVTQDWSVMSAGNLWKPLAGQTVTLQMTAKMPAAATSARLYLYVDGSNNYQFSLGTTGIGIYRNVYGLPQATLGTSGTILPTSNSTYTLTIAIDANGTMTAKVYSGTSATGTPANTLTVTDTMLTGNFKIAVGGNNGVVITNASVIAPKPDGWLVAGDSRVAWALTPNAINGAYSLSAVGIGSGVLGSMYQTISGTAGQSYTLSGFMNTINVGNNGAEVRFNWNTTGGMVSRVSGTTIAKRYSTSSTMPSGATGGAFFLVLQDSGTAVFDAIQLEQKPYATSYIRNDSTTAPAVRQPDQVRVPFKLPSKHFGALVWKPDFSYQANVNRTLFYSTNTASTTFTKRHLLQVFADTTGAIFISLSKNGIDKAQLSLPQINQGDTMFVAWTDDPNGNLTLWTGLNGASLQKTTVQSTQPFSDVTDVFIGCRDVSNNYEANGTIDFPLLTDMIPTDEQVQALYESPEWGGVRNWPNSKVLTGDVTLAGGPVDALGFNIQTGGAAGISSYGRSIHLMSGQSVYQKVNNYQENGVDKFVTSQYNALQLALNGIASGQVVFRTSLNNPSAGLPINWDAWRYMLYSLGGGFKVQSGTSPVGTFTSNTNTSMDIPLSGFTGAPVVIVSIDGSSIGRGDFVYTDPTSTTKDGFRVWFNFASTTGVKNIKWFAIGS